MLSQKYIVKEYGIAGGNVHNVIYFFKKKIVVQKIQM